MNNLQVEGWDFTDLKYIDMSESEVESYRLIPGDILFNRTNGSRELIGKCEVFRESGLWVFASYLIRLQLDQSRAVPEFIAAFLNTDAGRAQIERVSRQILMSNINAEEIRSLEIPLPPLKSQSQLAVALANARENKTKRLAEADELISALGSVVLDRLRLQAPSLGDPTTPFAVRLGAIRGRRIDPSANRPFSIHKTPHGLPIRRLAEVATIDGNAAPRPAADDDPVPYVGLPECDIDRVREVTARSYSEVRGRGVVVPGDILFARIEPSVFNRKYVLVEDLMGYEFAYTSTEFYTLRAMGDDADQLYLYAALRSDFVFAQVQGQTTGSSGRRRLDPKLFAELKIPWPVDRTRAAIAAEVSRRRDAARLLRAAANDDWQAAKERFESELLGRRAS